MFRRYRQVTNDLVNLVNAPRGSVQQRVRNSLAKPEAFEELHLLANNAHRHGFAVGTNAEASLKLSSGQMLITAAGSWFGKLADNDLLLAAVQGEETVNPHLPPYSAWHRRIYANGTAGAVLFSAPAVLLALADRHDLLHQLGIGGLLTHPPAPASFQSKSGVLLATGGLWCWGASAIEVLVLTETLAHQAAILVQRALLSK